MATTANKAERKGPGKVGCLAIVLVLAGAVVAVGFMLGRKQDASKTPCERYVTVMDRALDNCSSGATRNHDHHLAVCNQSVDPTPACLERIETMSCGELENAPSTFGDVCRKK